MLLAALVMLANYTSLPMFNTSIKYTLPAGKKIKSDIYKKPVEVPITSPSDYTIIADQNLFHPERKIPTEKKDENSLPKPEFVLYGTLITDDISLAYLEDLKAPFSSPGRGNRQTALRRGDTLSSFILKNIEADKVTMVRGEETVLVYLNDTQRPKTRETSAPATALAPRRPAPVPGQSSVIPPTKFQPMQSPTRGNYRGQKAINRPITAPSTN
jgi:hypothetical protein